MVFQSNFRSTNSSIIYLNIQRHVPRYGNGISSTGLRHRRPSYFFCSKLQTMAISCHLHIVKGYSLSLCWWSYHWHNKETRRVHDTSLWYSTAYVSQIEFCTINITDCFLPHKYDEIKKTFLNGYFVEHEPD
jgi:hypothetical protein